MLQIVESLRTVVFVLFVILHAQGRIILPTQSNSIDAL